MFLRATSDRVCLQEMSVGYANGIRVMSMTHTGEPGFMLYIPIEVQCAHQQTLFDQHATGCLTRISLTL